MFESGLTFLLNHNTFRQPSVVEGWRIAIESQLSETVGKFRNDHWNRPA